MIGFFILQNKSMSASSEIASTVYSILQKPYLKARLRKELTWLIGQGPQVGILEEISEVIRLYKLLEAAEQTTNVERCMRFSLLCSSASVFVFLNAASPTVVEAGKLYFSLFIGSTVALVAVTGH